MKYLTEDVKNELVGLISDQLSYLDEFVIPLSEEDLIWKPGQYRWNILEVIEHLNRFGDFYIPKVRNAVAYPKSAKKGDFYRSSFLGEFAFKQVRPVNGVVVNKVKAQRSTTPFLRKLDRSVIKDHIIQQNKLLTIINESDDVNWSKNRLPTMIASWIKLNLGDSLRIIIYHSERHYVQIENLHKKSID